MEAPYVPSLRVTIAGRTKNKKEVRKEKQIAKESRHSFLVAKSFLIHHNLMAKRDDRSLDALLLDALEACCCSSESPSPISNAWYLEVDAISRLYKQRKFAIDEWVTRLDPTDLRALGVAAFCCVFFRCGFTDSSFTPSACR